MRNQRKRNIKPPKLGNFKLPILRKLILPLLHDACKAGKAIVIGPDVGDVGAPDSIRLFGIEMPVEDVFQLAGEVS